MKLLWVFALANAVAVSFGVELLEDIAKSCSCDTDCPQITCFAAPTCSNGRCAYTQKPMGAKCPGQSCSNGGVCDDDANDYCNAKAECINGFKPSTTTCRAASGQCDVAETCTGSSGMCPIDSYQPPTMSCSGASNGGPCDAEDKCDGFGSCIDVFLPSTTICRKAAGACDVAETCSGTSGSCPVDQFALKDKSCSGSSNAGACDGQDVCDGKGNCIDVYLPSTAVCRASKGECDLAETCSGTSSACPADGFAGVTTQCTGTCNGGLCDDQDYCDGKGKCVDKFKPSTEVCRTADGACDVAETCTGSSSSCPANKYATTSVPCTGKSNGGECDAQDYCDGNGGCADKYQSSTFVCRAAKGECDVAETCSGTSGACPTNAFKSSSVPCTGTCNGNPCDAQDYCDGKGNCVDKYQDSKFVCRVAKGACDVAETCSGSSSQCPVDAFAATTVTCSGTSTGGDCDAQDYCDGKGNCVDKYSPSSKVCRPTKGDCDVAETCSGSSGQCPTNVFASTAVKCTGTSNGGGCDAQDYCDGNGNCIDKYQGSGFVCRAAKGDCDVAEICCGSKGACPADTFAGTSTKCSGTCNGNPCDDQDYCDGKGKCVDKYKPSGTVCGTKGNPCILAATCSGDMGFCPPDDFASSSTSCTGTKSGGICDGRDVCDGEGSCVDKFLNGVVCQKPAWYSRPTYCNGKTSSCPVSSYLSLREVNDDDVAVTEQLLATMQSSSSPLVLLGLVCVVAIGVALVAMRQQQRNVWQHDYKELFM
ncbi:hypothetical protein SDRG_11684 [Saprolegnia diclina VS20]|uniref:Disintegrin domain-containing protein n=1 Tax=Saprolegnia diclina (strain VS20) TaxID=1156394 RepID=T0PYK0_SAPDV|nr:hypothetical protein SDRG_11684 [Saprolegnia diclina VS20]EQC30629.1 hypothetical protein SDRG_11684 [Saprolegnia diclina VS20]|eukprot:XP_008615955.1 hypothetical protein SDRG_11684 [Saprolegnia diclina VS20]